MSKTKTLFTMALLVLLGSMGAAQAENELYEVKVFTTPAVGARAGGEDEMSGGVLLNFTPNPSSSTSRSLSITPSLSQADIPSGTQPSTTGDGLTTSLGTTVVGEAEEEDNDDNGTITITAISAGSNLLIRGVMLDVSGASGNSHCNG